MLEIGVRQSLGAFAGDSSDYSATVLTNQDDGAPRHLKCKAEGGDEAHGEKLLEGLARVGPC